METYYRSRKHSQNAIFTLTCESAYYYQQWKTNGARNLREV